VKADENWVLNLFQKYGEIESIFLKKKFIDPLETTGIVYCFVTFENEQSVTNAMADRNLIFQ
jgi:RNA recognition motif-containing protein